jgi:hypothetical protein
VKKRVGGSAYRRVGGVKKRVGVSAGRRGEETGRRIGGRDALLCLGRKHRLHSFGYIVYTLPWGGKLG